MGWIGCCFRAFRTIWVRLGSFGWLTKLGAKRDELVQKFVPRSRVGIFRNECTRSTPLAPKLMLWCVAFHWVHSGPFGCLTKLGAKRAELVQKFVPRSYVGIFRYESTRSTPLEPKLMFWVKWGGSGALVVKNSPRHRGTNFCTRSARFQRVS